MSLPSSSSSARAESRLFFFNDDDFFVVFSMGSESNASSASFTSFAPSPSVMESSGSSSSTSSTVTMVALGAVELAGVFVFFAGSSASSPSSASTTSTSVVFAVPVAVSPARAVPPDDAAVEASLDAFTDVSRASSPSSTSSKRRPNTLDSPVRAHAHATTTTTRAMSARRTRRAVTELGACALVSSSSFVLLQGAHRNVGRTARRLVVRRVVVGRFLVEGHVLRHDLPHFLVHETSRAVLEKGVESKRHRQHGGEHGRED